MRIPLAQKGTPGAFPQHGDFEAYLDGRVVVTEIYGPWNDELSDDYWRQAFEVMAKLDEGGPWVTSLIIRGSAVLSPEGFALLRSRLLASIATERKAAAIVIAPDVEGYGLVDDLYAACYEGICPMRIFETTEAANAWLDSFLEA